MDLIHGGSDGKESACDVGDLGWEDPLKEGMVTHSSILAWRIPWAEVWQATAQGVTKSRTQLRRSAHDVDARVSPTGLYRHFPSVCVFLKKMVNFVIPLLLLLPLNHSVMPDSLWPLGLQHSRLPCPSPTPGACSDSCLLV